MKKKSGSAIIILWKFSCYLLIGAVIYSCGISNREVPSSRVPETVLSAYKRMYHPTAEIKWQLQKGFYVARWTENGQELKAKFDAEGKLITN